MNTENSVNADAQLMAADAGFALEDTGGGFMAFRKDDGKKYWLITQDDGLSVSGNPYESAWIVGCYNANEEDDEATYKWNLVREAVTLEQAFQLYTKLPEPSEFEQTIENWGDLGISLGAKP